MVSPDGSEPVLSYAVPAGKPRHPPWMTRVGWASALAGAVVGGVVLPCAGLDYALFVLKDPGGPLFWPVAMVIGGGVGAVVAPLCVLSVYWVLWWLAGMGRR
jgi:hypothetical protein